MSDKLTKMDFRNIPEIFRTIYEMTFLISTLFVSMYRLRAGKEISHCHFMRFQDFELH